MFEELKKPKVYGDRLIPLIAKVDKEIQIMDAVFTDRDDIFYFDDDLANIARFQNKLREIYNDLATDRVRGDNALDTIKYDLINRSPYQDLIYRMIEAEIFPEITALFRFCEEH